MTLADDSGKNNIISRLIKADIAVFAMHTNVDVAPFGLND